MIAGDGAQARGPHPVPDRVLPDEHPRGASHPLPLQTRTEPIQQVTLQTKLSSPETGNCFFAKRSSSKGSLVFKGP